MSHLSLFLPSTLATTPQRLPALETLLARADRHCGQPSELRQQLMLLCGLSVPDDQDAPLGPLGALGDDLEATSGFWLCAEPVHLIADQDKVYLAARADALEVSAEEAAILTTEFNALFRDDGWQLWAPTPTRWYLRLPQRWQLRTAPPEQAMGAALWPYLPQGQDGMRLQAALNEIQMLFHTSTVNARRSEAGWPSLNSLWLWGGAELPQVPALPWRRLQGDDCLLRGIARAAGSALGHSSSAAQWLQGEGDGLVLLEGDMATLEQDWFAPLLTALRNGLLTSLDLHLLSSSACRYRIDRRMLRRWWRRQRPLAALIGKA